MLHGFAVRCPPDTRICVRPQKSDNSSRAWKLSRYAQNNKFAHSFPHSKTEGETDKFILYKYCGQHTCGSLCGLSPSHFLTEMPAPSSEGAELDLCRLAILRFAQNDTENMAWKNGTAQRSFPTRKVTNLYKLFPPSDEGRLPHSVREMSRSDRG